MYNMHYSIGHSESSSQTIESNVMNHTARATYIPLDYLHGTNFVVPLGL